MVVGGVDAPSLVSFDSAAFDDLLSAYASVFFSVATLRRMGILA